MGGAVDVELYAVTDVGSVRARNEDAYVVGDLDGKQALARGQGHTLRAIERGPLLVVCDGMGGGTAGDIASSIAAQTIWDEMASARHSLEVAVFARLLRRAIRAANDRVRRESEKLEEGQRMGTTAAAVAVVGDTLIVAHVGDCRAYLSRGGQLAAMTRDQSVVSALVAAGKMSEVDARFSSRRSMVLQALGISKDVEVSISVATLRRGDRLVLCSDGLHGVVPARAIESALARSEGLENAASRLVNLAKVAGAPDNVTAILAAFGGDGLESADAGDSLRFREYDPREEGDAAYADTSYVARRLARRAGLREASSPRAIPATGRYDAVTEDDIADELESRGPAERALGSQRTYGVGFWAVVAAAVIALAIALSLWSAL